MATLSHYAIFDTFPEIKAWTSTREGGISKKPYESLNLSFELGDDSLSVSHNRSLIQKQLPKATWVELKQVHGTDILWIHHLPKREKNWGLHLAGEADAMITRLENVCLIIKHADCQAALIYDPVQKILAVVHAGWRGLVGGIYNKVIDELIRTGSNPQDLRVAISPSLGACCSQFIHWEKELGTGTMRFLVPGSAFCFDLQAISFEQLLACGLTQSHISIDKTCTRCEQTYFSHRRGDGLGRLSSGIQMTFG